MPTAWTITGSWRAGWTRRTHADRNGDDDSDGYTNLEAFLSELAADPAQ